MIKYKEAFNNFLKKNNIFYDYYSALNDKKSIEWRGLPLDDFKIPKNFIRCAFKWSDFLNAWSWHEYSLKWEDIVRNNDLSQYYNKDLNKNIRVL